MDEARKKTDRFHIREHFDSTFHSLRNRNFRYFWTGQCVSQIGSAMQRTAQYWLIYTLTDSPLAVGMLGVCQFVPILLLSLPAGALIDRIPKRPLIITTQVLYMAQAALLTLLTWSGVTQYWHIFVLSALQGVTQSFDMPTRQTFLYELVGPADIMNAVSLHSTVVNLSKIFGPALAGLVMLQLGIPVCFLINTLSFIAVIGGLLMIRMPKTATQRTQIHIGREILDGLRFIRRQNSLVAVVLIFGIVSTFALNHEVIAPVFADDVLGQGANGYTGLLTALGIGSLIGALFMATRSRSGVKGHRLILGGIATALLQILTICTTSYPISLILLGLIGFANLVFLNTANVLFQTNTPDEYRARVMSIYSLLLFGSTPAGNFFAGVIMDNIPGDSGFVGCGLLTLLLLIPVLIMRRTVISDWMRGHKGPAVNKIDPP